MMNQGARDANAESARLGQLNAQTQIFHELRMMNELLAKILETLQNPPQHLWPRS